MIFHCNIKIFAKSYKLYKKSSKTDLPSCVVSIAERQLSILLQTVAEAVLSTAMLKNRPQYL